MMAAFFLTGVLMLAAWAAPAQTFRCGKAHRGETALTTKTLFRADAAGFDLAAPPARIAHESCSSATTFFFSTPANEGNYLVSVELGGHDDAITTVRAEARRLVLARVQTHAGEHRTETFLVNLRRPEIAGGGEVHRKPREMKSLDWDNKLTLEFSGTNPSVRSISLQPAPPSLPTIYLAGDSTVVDQDAEPWAAWGQMLPSFFTADVAVANHAESGETIASFEREGRFDKIFSTLKRGDYLFFQFAHNDQKPGGGYVAPEQYTALLRKYIALAGERGATAVLVTSMNRRTFDADGHIRDTLAPYPQLMRDLAASDKVALIDLNSMSRTLYEVIGEPASKSLFVYAAANTYPNQPEALHDDTHFNSYGAYELARCVVAGIQQLHLPLVNFLRDPQQKFDPARPDAPASVALPPTPSVDTAKPYER